MIKIITVPSNCICVKIGWNCLIQGKIITIRRRLKYIFLIVWKHELAQILYPVFLHFYLELVNKNQSKLASEFFDKFSKLQVAYHVNDLKQLKLITNKDQMDKSEFKDTISAGKYNIKLCEDSYRQLKDFVKVHEFKRLVEIIKNNMLLESKSLKLKLQKTVFLANFLNKSTMGSQEMWSSKCCMLVEFLVKPTQIVSNTSSF